MEALGEKSKKRPNSKSKESKVERPMKWSKNKHSFEVSGTTFVLDERYEYIRQIGMGAYGVVCSCHDKKTNKDVAVKKVVNSFDVFINTKRTVRATN